MWCFRSFTGTGSIRRATHEADHRFDFFAAFFFAAGFVFPGIMDAGFLAIEHRFEASTLVGFRRRDAGEVAESGEQVAEVDVSGCAAAGLDAVP